MISIHAQQHKNLQVNLILQQNFPYSNENDDRTGISHFHFTFKSKLSNTWNLPVKGESECKPYHNPH